MKTKYLLALLGLFACRGVIDEPRGEPPAAPPKVQPPTTNPNPDPTPRAALEFECPEGSVFDPGPTLARRLTIFEYINTVRDVLGVDISAEARASLPADLRAEGFTNTANAQVVTYEHVEAFDAVARTAVERIADLSALIDSHTACRDLTDACIHPFVDGLGRRMFRSPLTSAEREALAGIFVTVATEGDGFEVGAGFAIRAMLQSPRFLYRAERQNGDGTPRTLDPYETASRIAYLVWQSAPDDTLLEAAANDELQTPAQITAQVERLLADSRAQDASHQYLTDWLNLDRLDNLQRDTTQYPTWDEALGRAMKAETIALFDHLVWTETAPLSAMFDAEVTFVSRRLAEHYGFESPVDGIAQYDLSAIAERRGLLTHGGLLTIGGNRASLVEKGLWMLESVLCGHVDAPPADVVMTMGDVEPGSTQRTYSEQRMMNSTCRGCHIQMDPLAYGLERFDGTGAYSETDSFGNDLGMNGEFVVPGDPERKPFSSVDELAALVGSDARVEDCLVLKPMQYSLGRPIVTADGCSLDVVRSKFHEGGRTYQSLMIAIATAPTFVQVRTEP